MIKTIIRLKNDMVMVFDAEGEQLPEYQGQYEEVKTGILRDAPPDAIFVNWFGYRAEPEAVCRAGW
jgi:hypothetical protein